MPPVWEVVEALEFSRLPVLLLTSDGAAPNRRFYKLCRIKDKTHKTPNPFADRDLYFFCDPPHLLKTLSQVDKGSPLAYIVCQNESQTCSTGVYF